MLSSTTFLQEPKGGKDNRRSGGGKSKMESKREGKREVKEGRRELEGEKDYQRK